MERRGFLTSLGLGAVGAIFCRAVPDVLCVSPATINSVKAGSLAGLDLFTELFHSELKKRFKGERFPVLDGYRVGDGPLNHQFHVRFEPREGEWTRGEIMMRYVEPGVDALAGCIRDVNPVGFGRLMLPNGGALASRIDDGISLRGVQQFYAPTGLTQMRFDVLVAGRG